MIVGVMVWELHLPACQSLKDKRTIVKSLKDRLHNRFNVSVAETGHQDLWQRAELSAAVVSTDRRHAESVLREVDGMVAAADGARVMDTSVSYL
ncbi:MAG TPA: DUF503 domain-containing protein [Gemmatimonadales bacterium]|nr:DUF503 domain-containing protein [Gemmatimonadales bacterium]